MLARRLAGFLGDRRGNVAIIFGIAFIPIVVAGGSGVDLARAFIVQQRLAHALDAAALAVGTSLEKTDAQLEALAQSFFDANYPAQELGVPGALSMAINDNVITISASADVDTAFMRIVGYNEMSVGASSEVTRKLTGLEVVLVLDNTGSMGSNGKIGALKSASTELVKILFGDQTNPDYLKIGLVPFSAAVNVGTQYENSGWIDTTGASSVNGLNFSNGRHAMQVYNLINNKSWNGCVEARPMPMDVEDTTPSADNPDTLWVPYFAPDEPDLWSWPNYYYNSYLSDGTNNSNMQTRQARYQKYNNQYIWGDGPHYNCKTQPITPLTNDKQDILDAIDDMNATGNTNISFGMAWGWRVISPTEPFTEGTAYDDKKFRKAIILLTDGDNVIGQTGNHNKSTYSAYGYVKDGRLGVTSAPTADAKLDERTSTVCTNIKNAYPDQPITVYTITFQVNGDATKTLMRNCATDAEKYFDSPSNAELTANFKIIAGELSELRISK
jgi:Flp pilus assembly protein TadG